MVVTMINHFIYISNCSNVVIRSIFSFENYFKFVNILMMWYISILLLDVGAVLFHLTLLIIYVVTQEANLEQVHISFLIEVSCTGSARVDARSSKTGIGPGWLETHHCTGEESFQTVGCRSCVFSEQVCSGVLSCKHQLSIQNRQWVDRRTTPWGFFEYRIILKD